MSKVYIVTGSEDGIIATCGNIRLAYRLAYEYCENSCDEIDHDEMLTLNQVREEFKEYSTVSVSDHKRSFADACIEVHELQVGS